MRRNNKRYQAATCLQEGDHAQAPRSLVADEGERQEKPEAAPLQQERRGTGLELPSRGLVLDADVRVDGLQASDPVEALSAQNRGEDEGVGDELRTASAQGRHTAEDELAGPR